MSRPFSQNEKQKTSLPGPNSPDRYCCRSQCAICQSTFHWAKDCSLRDEQVKLTEDSKVDDVGDCNATLYTKESATEAEIFSTEGFGSAVMGPAHTQIACGQEWLFQQRSHCF